MSERPLLVFDGDCGFCTTSANAAMRWLHLEQVEPAERSVIAVPRHAGGPWGVLGAVSGLPGARWLAGVADRLVARNRDRLPAGTAACRLPQR